MEAEESYSLPAGIQGKFCSENHGENGLSPSLLAGDGEDKSPNSPGKERQILCLLFL